MNFALNKEKVTIGMKKNEKEVNIKYIELEEINPYVRRASMHYVAAGLDTGIRINIHYQLHFILKGKGSIKINHNVYVVKEGDFLIWGPGEMHCIISDSIEPMQVIGIQFDFTHNFSEVNYPCIHYTKANFSWDKVNEKVYIRDEHELKSYYHIRNVNFFKKKLEEVVNTYNENNRYAKHIMSGLLKVIIVSLLKEETSVDNKFKIKRDIVMDVRDYMDEHYQQKITNADLGDRFGYHPNHLNQMFIQFSSYTIQQYLIHIRINKAIDLLESANLSVSEIGNYVGGYSIHYFSRLFKKKTGLYPSAFRNK